MMFAIKNHMSPAQKISQSSPSKAKERRFRFAVCVKNDNYLASLELRKICKVLPDHQAEGQGLSRVIDESGEDYLYPQNYFLPVSLSSVGSQSLCRQCPKAVS